MTPLTVAVIATGIVLILRVPLRIFGRWLQRKGTDLEHNRAADEDSKPDPFERP